MRLFPRGGAPERRGGLAEMPSFHSAAGEAMELFYDKKRGIVYNSAQERG